MFHIIDSFELGIVLPVIQLPSPQDHHAEECQDGENTCSRHLRRPIIFNRLFGFWVGPGEVALPRVLSAPFCRQVCRC